MIRKLNSHFWFIFLPAHILFVISIIKIDYSFQSFLVTLLFWTLISGYGIGVGFHRLLSHKSFKTRPVFEALVSFFGCFGIQGSPIFWVNLHRGYHHPHSDTEKDIHSPIKGHWWAYLLWPNMIDYDSLSFSFVNDLLRKNTQLYLHRGYFFIISITWIVFYFLFEQVFYALVMAQVITLHQEFCVNLFCHSGTGYRNFDLPDKSVNRYFFGLFFWGVGYHNNHHANPNKYDFSYKKNEFDPTVILVKLIETRPK